MRKFVCYNILTHNMHWLDIITILIFSVAVLLTGVSLSRSGKDLKGFFGGGGNIPWGMSGLSLFMGFFSAGTFVVWGSIAYSSGLVAIIIQLTMAIAGFLVGTFIAPRWNQAGCLTAAEYITSEFGLQTQKTYTMLFLAVSIFTSGSFLYPVAKILEVASGVPLSVSIVALGIFCIIYTSLGGLRGVMVTDVLQFVILFTAVVIAIPLSFGKVGGLGEFISNTPEAFFNCFSGEYTPWFIFAFCLYNAVFIGGNWSYVQRYTSVSTRKDARKVGWLFGCLYLISPILWMLPPMIYRVFNPGLVGLENENAYLLMCKEALPSGLLGLMLGGMVFATASSLNGTLNISAGVFTNDIYKRLRPSASDRSLINVARISTVFFGLLAIIIALLVKSMGGIVNVVISVAALTGVPLYLPVIWSMFSRRQTGRTLLSVTFISLAINIFFKFLAPGLIGLTLSRGQEMMMGAIVPIVLLSVIELYLKAIGSERAVTQVRRTTDSVDNPIVSEEDRKLKAFTNKVLGISIMTAGSMVVILGMIAKSAKVVPVIAGVVVIGIGLFIYSKSRKLNC